MQAKYVDQLHSSGVLDDSEHDSFAALVDQLLRCLARGGAVWHAPRLSEVGQGLFCILRGETFWPWGTAACTASDIYLPDRHACGQSCPGPLQISKPPI